MKKTQRELKPHEIDLYEVFETKLINLTEAAHVMLPKKDRIAAMKTIKSRIYQQGRFYIAEIKHLRSILEDITAALQLFIDQEEEEEKKRLAKREERRKVDLQYGVPRSKPTIDV